MSDVDLNITCAFSGNHSQMENFNAHKDCILYSDLIFSAKSNKKRSILDAA